MKSRANTLAAAGLVLGAVCGSAGMLSSQADVRAGFWAIGAIGVVVASALMMLDFASKKREIIAAGYLVFAIGEGVMLSGASAGAIGSRPSVGTVAALWAVALLLISGPRGFPIWVRAFGCAAATLFAIVAAQSFLVALSPRFDPWQWAGNQSMSFPVAAYSLLVVTFVGWISVLLKDKSD